eukprot:TRINITY_DN3167_c0_g1_i2.p2 TRINITY_DN3167_c0_g1~~TRINITY_DN3167_c0_g1_i2.p2  ORF type:complete len:206 (-),score=31.24 TRINITY_DN3167_c0_g1_i2:835-1452(-)
MNPTVRLNIKYNSTIKFVLVDRNDWQKFLKAVENKFRTKLTYIYTPNGDVVYPLHLQMIPQGATLIASKESLTPEQLKKIASTLSQNNNSTNSSESDSSEEVKESNYKVPPADERESAIGNNNVDPKYKDFLVPNPSLFAPIKSPKAVCYFETRVSSDNPLSGRLDARTQRTKAALLCLSQSEFKQNKVSFDSFQQVVFTTYWRV